jgi:hypothetical protein
MGGGVADELIEWGPRAPTQTDKPHWTDLGPRNVRDNRGLWLGLVTRFVGVQAETGKKPISVGMAPRPATREFCVPPGIPESSRDGRGL